MSRPSVIIEVCVDSWESAVLANRHGADRLELCAALDVGGVTPCRSLISAVRREVECPLIVLIRPRAGDFVCRPSESQQIVESAEEALGQGADGIAVGALTQDGQLDLSLLGSLRNRFTRCQIVLHRCFDSIPDKPTALEQLVEMGFDRVLTSGGPVNAQDGIACLRILQQQSAGRIAVMPGGGVTTENAAKILAETGCRQLHGSFRARDLAAQLTPFGANRSFDVLALERTRREIESGGLNDR